MLRFREFACKEGLTGCVIRVAPALISWSMCVAAQGPSNSASLQGFVRDANDRAVAGVTVSLKSEDNTPSRTVSTDSKGHYGFSGIPGGTYSLHAEKPGLGEVTVPAVTLRATDAKNLDLRLGSLTASSQAHSATPEFFDEPHFTVAGVSDTTNLGGHGSDVVVRTTATLARDTASLGREKIITTDDSATEASLREDLKRDSLNVEANYRLGKLLADQGKPRDAIPYLEQATRLNPSNYESSYELAAARASVGEYSQAQAGVQDLLARKNKPELHHLLADIAEKQGHPIDAVREYQQAAEMNPSEPNLFDWGSELLLHAAPEPALEVFSKGRRQYPTSSRMLVGLGVALYARGSYDQAIDRICEASDLKPDDPMPYLFLGKMQNSETSSSVSSARDHLHRFLNMQPENALANYYYAKSLWNQSGNRNDAELVTKIESLLEKAVHLDPNLGNAYLLLGNVYSEQHDLQKAVAAYKSAAGASPPLAQAHYQLAQAYRQAGEISKAQDELKLYERVSKEDAERTVHERREMQEFVYTLRESSSAKPQ